MISEVSISLSEGWNLITGISTPVMVENIFDNGGIIFEGSIFGFDQVYQEAEVLLVGKGYWLKASSSGIVIVSD